VSFRTARLCVLLLYCGVVPSVSAQAPPGSDPTERTTIADAGRLTYLSDLTWTSMMNGWGQSSVIGATARRVQRTGGR
jgi:hypothetical protein